MEIDVIKKKLSDRFAAPLPDFYQRRIIFWYDEEQSFKELIDTVEIPGVKLLKLTGSNLDKHTGISENVGISLVAEDDNLSADTVFYRVNVSVGPISVSFDDSDPFLY